MNKSLILFEVQNFSQQLNVCITYLLLIIQVCFMSIFCSCQNRLNTVNYSREDLEGTWAIDIEEENILRKVAKDGHREYSWRHFTGDQLGIKGFSFYKDSCDYKAGFYDYADMDNGLPLPIDSKTIYKIASDTLKIWDLGKSEWKKILIERLTNDTLVLREVEDDRLFKYHKVKKSSQTNEDFDEIILATVSPDYLSDEFYYLDKQGAYIYQKFDVRGLDTIRYPIYRYRLKSSQLETIKRNFDYVDVDSLKEEYHSSHLGDRTYFFLFFIKNGKITKVINDDNGVSPDELQWGYVPLMYLRRLVSMEHITDIKDCPGCIKLREQTPAIMKEIEARLGWDWDIIRARKVK